jgi:hypothetical protein
MAKNYQNLHSRRKAASAAKKASKNIDQMISRYVDADARARSMLENLRVNAAVNPDTVYEHPVVLVTADVLGFGEAAEIAVKFADEIHEPIKCLHLLKGLVGLTVAEVTGRFLREQDAMADHLATISAVFALLKAGVATEDMVRLGANHFAMALELLGLRKLDG